MIHCEYGFDVNSAGCEICKCREAGKCNDDCYMMGAPNRVICSISGCSGCPFCSDGEETYNCYTKEVWSDAKTAWCCANQGLSARRRMKTPARTAGTAAMARVKQSPMVTTWKNPARTG